MKRKNKALRREIYEDTSSVLFESFQNIQVNLDYASIDKNFKTLSCVSAAKGEGKTTTLANLGYVYSLKGYKVIIVDLDLRSPSIHYLFNIPNEKGITDYLANKATKEEIIQKNVKEKYDVITAGSKVPLPTKILESQKLVDFINELKKEYDYVLIDVAPLLLFADTIVISKFVDAFIYIVAINESKRNEIKEAEKIIKSNKLNVVGTLITKSPIKKKKSGYYHGYYR